MYNFSIINNIIVIKVNVTYTNKIILNEMPSGDVRKENCWNKNSVYLLAQVKSEWASWNGPKDFPIMEKEKKTELFQGGKKVRYKD